MRLKASIEIDQLPIIYRHRFMSLIKAALEREDVEYMRNLYPEDSEKRILKPFCFNVALPEHYSQERKPFPLGPDVSTTDTVFMIPKTSYITLEISSYDNVFFEKVCSGLLNLRMFQVPYDYNGHSTMVIKDVKVVKPPRITTSSVRMSVKSIAVIPMNKWYGMDGMVPDRTNLMAFEHKLNELQDAILMEIRGVGLYKRLNFLPYRISERRAKHTMRGYRHGVNPCRIISGFAGTFTLEGHPDDLDAIYLRGLGTRTGQGFGMLNLLEST